MQREIHIDGAECFMHRSQLPMPIAPPLQHSETKQVQKREGRTCENITEAQEGWLIRYTELRLLHAMESRKDISAASTYAWGGVVWRFGKPRLGSGDP